MALHFSCALKIKDKSEMLGIIAKLGEEFHFEGFQHDDDFFHLCICEGANLEIQFGENSLTFYCQGTPAGPGAHAKAMDFVDKFMHSTGIYGDYTDDTGYAEHRDFSRLQKAYNDWLLSVVEFSRKAIIEDKVSELAAAWDPNWFHPEPAAGTMLTYMGRFGINELCARIKNNGIADFARDFFIWNNRELDAWFFRNLAFFHIWKDCFFQPSSRSGQDEQINGYILNLLEEVIKSGMQVPFPKNTYLELCKLAEHEAMPKKQLDALPSFEPDARLGHRRGLITHFFGNQGIKLPGYFLEGQGDSGNARLFYDSMPDNWHGLTLWPNHVDGLVQNFDMDFFAGSAGEPEIFAIDNARCCAAFMGRQGEGDNVYYTVKAEVISAYQVNFISMSFKHETEKEWAFSLLRNIKVQDKEVNPNVNK